MDLDVDVDLDRDFHAFVRNAFSSGRSWSTSPASDEHKAVQSKSTSKSKSKCGGGFITTLGLG